MLHKNRSWCVVEIADSVQLARMLTENNYVLCAGFRHAGYLWLNDSFSEDGAQEYGVIKEETGEQVESITVSWCNLGQLTKYIRAISAGVYDDQAWDSGINLETQVQAPEQHSACPLCV